MTANAHPNISFEWPETERGAESCEPGLYAGTWECLSLDAVPFAGQVNFRFERSSDGEFLELVDAKLEGAWTAYLFTSGLEGRLSCATLEFDAIATDGVWGPGGVPQGTFTGTLLGTLDPVKQQIHGQWHLQSNIVADCKGTWTAELVPP